MKLEAQILIDASAFSGEWRRDLIAVALCVLIMVAVLAIQEWDLRRAATRLGWFGGSSLVVTLLGAAVLIAFGFAAF
jgi:hypothetical protein